MEDRNLEYFKRMTVELRRARERAARLEAARTEPVAVVGVGVRLPGGVGTPERLWDVLAAGESVIGEFPADRGWDPDWRVLRGGFLDDAAGFDAEFFGISPREAESMDPQQRVLLETAWQAVERAGTDPATLHGQDVGVFVGASVQGYGSGARAGSGNLMTGTALSVLSGRLAYVLGVHGPAVTVDTACSSSLVAVHQAIRALRAGECGTALAAGVTVMATPAIFAEFSRQGGLAPDGLCKSFAAAADGTGWAEGAGVLVLRRLSDAVRDGDSIAGVLRGSAVNSDGASNGLTAPNGRAQERVIRAALADAGLTPSEVDAVEGHGTGTTLGDPIEARALLATYGQERDRPLLLGSAKSNFGHTQAASGVIGVLKMLLALRHGVLPRTLHVDRPTEVVDWSAGAVSLLTEAVPWRPGERPRRAGVSSFGVSGTNAHVIVEEPPAVPDRPAVRETLVPLLVSARTSTALAAQAGRLASAVRDPAGAARALATARTPHEHRAVVVSADPAAALRELAAGRVAAGTITGIASDPGRPVFVFPGQGAQWAGMGRELLSEPVFADRMAECAEALESVAGWRLFDVLAADPLERADVLQPVSFAVLVSLAALWESCGVRPAAVVGHSQGEIAAACVAGALSLADAARIVVVRSRVVAAELAGSGGMLSVGLPAEEITLPAGVEVAVVNSSRSTVLAGDRGVLATLAGEYRARDVPVRLLPVDYASHTSRVDAVAARLAGLLAGTAGSVGAVPWMSAVDGDWVTGAPDSAYWVRNLRSPVRFRDAVAKLAAAGHRRFVEVSPHPVLTTAVEETVPGAAVSGTLRRDDGGRARFLLALGEFWTLGGDVDWPGVLPDVAPAEVPATVFEHTRYWLTPPRVTDAAAAGLGNWDHPILTTLVEDPGGDGFGLSGRLVRGDHPWLADHVIGGVPVAPGALLVDLALQAGRHAGTPVVEELVITEPLVLDADVDLRVVVAADRRGVTVFARKDEGWQRHASGSLTSAGAAPETGAWPPEGAQPVELTDFYTELADAGYAYGPAFQGLRQAWRRGGEWFAEIAVPGEGCTAHPAFLDAALHAGFLDDGERGLAFAWHGVEVHRAGVTAGRIRLRADEPRLVVADPHGAPLLTVASLTIRPPAAHTPAALLAVDWTPFDPAPASAEWTSARITSAPEALRALRNHSGPEPMVVLTRDAETDAGAAAVHGLVRAAQAESPGRFLLVDADDTPLDTIVPAALAAKEPELRVRQGEALVPRLRRFAPDGSVPGLGTVLITGGTGTLGSLVAEHLVRAHGVRHLVLVSRRGPAAPGVADLRERLGDVTVDVLAADLTDRSEVRKIIDGYPDLTSVIHATAAFGDALLSDLDESRLEIAWRGKAGIAKHLDELTRGRGLTAFVLFSSVAGLYANGGQGAYAAANAALDAIATRRRAAGEAATSIAWGLWSQPDGSLEARWRARSGLRVLDATEGLRLFDAALASTRPAVVAAVPDRAALRALAVLPPILRAFAPAHVPDRETGSLLSLVRTEAAAVLGAADIAADRAFRDAGFDSLTAVELRNRLAAVTGLRLPATLVFDHGTPRALARHLETEPGSGRPGAGRSFADVFRELDDRGADTSALRDAAALLRERAEDGLTVTTTWLTRGPGRRVICVPSISTWEPVLNFAAFAEHFRGEADVLVVVPPGYEDDGPVAASWPALVRSMAAAVRREAAGQPYVLIGYSSGGGVAQSVAAELAGQDAPDAVVLVDTYAPDQLPDRLQESFRQVLRGLAAAESVTHAKITASSVYVGLHNNRWVPAAVEAPVLMLLATDPTPAEPPLTESEWRHSWPFPHTARELPGDHFTIMSRHSDQVAAAVREVAAR